MTVVVGHEWRRLHPLTPVVKGWQPLVAALALGLQDGFGRSRLAITGGVAAVVVVIAGVGYYLNWRVSRYRLDGADLVLETGVIMRRSRRVPLARLQAVDVVRPLLARALGLAELRLEVAGGSNSNAALAYLEDATAHAVRNDLLVLAAGLRDDVLATPAPPEAHEVVLAVTPPARLVGSTVLSSGGLTFVAYLVGALVLSVLVVDARPIVLGSALPLVLGLGGLIWRSFATRWGSTLANSPDGIRIRGGLLETRAQTVPPGRVQGVVIHEPFLWRFLKWVSVSATVAGYDSGRSGGATLLPVAAQAEGRGVIGLVLPGIDWDRVFLDPAPRRARVRAPIELGRLGAGLGDEGAERVFVTRRGRFWQRTDIVPLARVQSVRLTQGPVQRRLRIATVHADLSAGPVAAVALHRDELEARVLVDRLVIEGRAARAAAGHERWMSGQLPSIG